MASISRFLFLLGFLTGPVVTAQKDPYDLSFFTRGAAIGDSYAAGIGAGNEVDYDCSRYDGSYANLVALQLGVQPGALDFTYSACSGAVIEDVVKQANALSYGQQFIIISAGGNDASLVAILNSCVYSFYAAYHPNCDKQLATSQTYIESTKFASDVSGLISAAQSKLAPGGNIYYVGYASFFDVTDNGCDSVSWHMWLNLFSTEYLTQARRQSMNQLVVLMNQALRVAVSNAGPQVHFIDYDDYVGMTNGRYCAPGQDEKSGNGANRPDLFFYEMKSVDSPWTGYENENDWSRDTLNRRQNDQNDDGGIQPANNTLNALYGAMIQEAIENLAQEAPGATLAIINNDNTNLELQEEVANDEPITEIVPKRSPIPDDRHFFATRRLKRTSNSGSSWNSTSKRLPSLSGRGTSVGTIIPSNTASSWNGPFTGAPSLSHMETRSRLGHGTNVGTVGTSNTTSSWNSASTEAPSLFHNDTNWTVGHGTNVGTTLTFGKVLSASNHSKTFSTSQQKSTTGTVIANSTHVLLKGGKVVEKVNVKKLFISDETSRVFHPTQQAHALIANLILYQMAADNAKYLGIRDFPPEYVAGAGGNVPQIGGAACTGDTSDTWADRDVMINAINSFCADPHNLKGTIGKSTTASFNPNSLDYMSVTIDWQQTANMGEHSCGAWLDVVADGCDVPGLGGVNAGNLKHGGSIAYDSSVVNATLTVKPLVMKRLWDKGQAGGQQCNDVTSVNYLAQSTLQDNINDYCVRSAAQPGGVASGGTSFLFQYNEGTPEALLLGTEWPSGNLNYQVFQEECLYYMGVLNNGCSLPDDNNPMNWKHGGGMSDGNGVKYTISPTQDRPPPPSSPLGHCKATWRVSHGYDWDLYGGGFDGADFGAALRTQVGGCGLGSSGTVDTFEYFPVGNADGTEWHATGWLPTAISDHCLAKAIKSAGGFHSEC